MEADEFDRLIPGDRCDFGVHIVGTIRTNMEKYSLRCIMVV